MGKSEYYIKLHKELSEKYNIPNRWVESIRSAMLGPQKMSYSEFIAWLKVKTTQKKGRSGHWAGRRSSSISYYETFLSFIANIPPKVLEDILRD